MKTVGYSCVVDGEPRFYFQSLLLLATLIERAQVNRQDIHVHLTGSCDAVVEDTYRALGVNVSRVDVFGRGGPCNKLRQLDNPALRRYDTIVLCDCDLTFDRNIAPDIDSIVLAAKIVDLPNPPLRVLREILTASGLRCRPALVPTTFTEDASGYQLAGPGIRHPQFSTLEHNCNGGLYVIAQHLSDDIRRGWARWATWLADRSWLLSEWAIHIDQVAFALMTWELGLSVTPLDVSYNCPLHLPGPWSESLAIPPTVLHFHMCFARSGGIAWDVSRPIGPVVERANAALNHLLAELATARPSLHQQLTTRRVQWLDSRFAVPQP